MSPAVKLEATYSFQSLCLQLNMEIKDSPSLFSVDEDQFEEVK